MLSGLLGAEPTALADGGASSVACVRRETLMPIDEGQAPLRSGLYFIRVDERKPIEVRSDRGTRVAGLDSKRRHTIALYRASDRIASLRVPAWRAGVLCLGLSNYGELEAFHAPSAAACGCR